MSLAGSCFSPKSAPRPFHHGIRERGGTIFWAALPSSDGRSKQTYELTSSIVPRGTSFHRSVDSVSFYSRALRLATFIAQAFSQDHFDEWNSMLWAAS